MGNGTLIDELAETLRRLSFRAQITGGVAGADPGLIKAIDDAGAALARYAAAKAEGAQAPVAWLYRAENGDIYEMLGGNDQAKFMRRYADDDRDWISLDEFNTMQPITTAPQSLPDSAQPDQVQAVAWRVRFGDDLEWGYCEEESDADWLIKQTGVRSVKEPLYPTPPAAPSDGALGQAVRALFENPEIAEMACIGSIAPVEHDLGVLQAELAKHDEHRAREIAEGKK